MALVLPAVLSAAVALAPALARPAAAQQRQPAAVADPASPTGAAATRPTLTAALAAAERRGDRATAATLRRRLTQGDIGPGDRLEVTLTLDTLAKYEFVVRDTQRVDVLPLGSFSLRGVLRSELPEAFRRFYLRYYRNPQVSVQSLVRVGFLGAVARPGYYSVPPDVPIAEAFRVTAGGATGNANLKKLQVKRGGQRLYDNKAFDRLSREGATFDEAGLRSGDEVRVPEKSGRNALQILQVGLFALSAFTSLVFLIRSANN